MSGIPRRDFIKLFGAAGAGLAAWPLARAADPQGSEKAGGPNILVFFTDDHGQWAQHAYGNSELQTPNLDRLAERGIRMRQAITTCPICSPARASFFTGRMPSQHGIHDYLKTGAVPHPGLAGQTLITELLKKAGYHTGLVGKWHCVDDRNPHPGFDRWFSYWAGQYPHKGTQHFSDQGSLVTEEGIQSPLLTRRVVDFLQGHRRNEGAEGRPFFLFVGYTDTHTPHKDAPEELVAKYDSATFRDIPVEKFAPCHGKPLYPVDPDPAVERRNRSEYYGAVSSLDREVGKVLDALEATGQLDNTLIIYTGDHGLNVGHHGMWEKGGHTTPQNFLEESVRVACTVSWPAGGVLRNATCDDQVNHADLWATILEVAGAVPDAKTAAAINSPGVSYLRQLRGHEVPDWRKTMISEYGNARMARTERYKLIKRYPYAGVRYPDELYDLREDPRETTNVHADPSLAGVVGQLSAELDQFFATYTVPGHSGLDMEHQPKCAPDSPWLRGPNWKPHGLNTGPVPA